jgi:anti-sigma regulatory factor (Ser/Thr protein kinase)
MTTTDSNVDLAGAVLGEQVQMQIPSLLEWITPTVEHLKERAVRYGVCDEKRGLKLSLVLHEALTNSVVHGNLGVSSRLKEEGDDAFARALAERGGDPAFNSRIVDINVDYDGDRCRWTLTDQGEGFDVDHVLRNDEPPEEAFLRPSGRGVLLMRAFMDEVHFEAGGRRVLLTMRRVCKKDQRQNPRVSVRRRVSLAPLHPDGSVDWGGLREGISQDLSEGGMSIFQKELARADRVVVGLEVDGRTLYVPAEVRHWRPTEAGLVELGCRFLPSTIEEETTQNIADLASVQGAVGALLRQHTSAPLAEEERRTHQRATYTARIELSGQATGPTFAFGRDLSRGGIAFITTAPVALEPLLLTLPVQNGQPLRVRAKVVRCAAVAAGFYDVGACFTGLAEEREGTQKSAYAG